MHLRPMRMEDADFLLELKNYPETRKYAIVSHDEIKLEDHLKYLEENLQYFKIIDNGWTCGAIRIKDNEISLWIDRRFWGKGIASYVLEAVSEKRMTARIVEGNIASMRAFINAGFKPISYHPNIETLYSEGHALTVSSGHYIFKK